jgi:cell division protein FtsW
LVLFMGILVLLGLVVLFAISPARVEMINQTGQTLDQAHFMEKQIIYLAAGLVAFVAATRIPIELWRRVGGKVLMLGFAACVILALLGAAHASPALCTNGACRWYNLGVGTFQPAELLKFGVLLFASGFLARRMKDGSVNDVHSSLIPLGVVAALAGLLVVGAEKDMGTGLTMIGMLLAILFVAGMNTATGVLVGAAAGGLGVVAVLLSPHRLARIATFVGSGTDATDTSAWHIQMANIAIGSGGFFGRGLGESIQAFGYLPEAVNDSIFAILGETFGFVGLVVILIVFAALLFRLLGIVDRLQDTYLRLLVAGTFGWIATHVIVNVGAMIGVFPLTGVTLPFLSFGGTSLLFTMTILGIAFQASRYTTHRLADPERNTKQGERNEATRRGRGLGRPRYAR